MFVAKSDLSNFYHHLGLPKRVQQYMALPPLTATELDSIGLSSADGAWWPICVTLPMGFSHAVFIAETGQSIRVHILCRTRFTLLDIFSFLVRELTDLTLLVLQRCVGDGDAALGRRCRIGCGEGNLRSTLAWPSYRPPTPPNPRPHQPRGRRVDGTISTSAPTTADDTEAVVTTACRATASGPLDTNARQRTRGRAQQLFLEG
jgi:hypothetical protein